MRIASDHVGDGGLLVVLSGPSGVGKDVVLSELEQIYPSARRCVTTTTRKKREGEVDGVDYTFVSVDEFKKGIEQGAFLEYADVYGNLYGSPRKWVEENLGKGFDIILKIDVQGGIAVKKIMPSAVMVFLAPPSMEELERRLRGRLTESDGDLAKRLSKARWELDQIKDYEYIIENDSIRKAAEDLKAVIVAEHCKIRR